MVNWAGRLYYIFIDFYLIFYNDCLDIVLLSSFFNKYFLNVLGVISKEIKQLHS